MKEKAIEDKLTEELARCGFLTYKFESPGTRGVPDQIAISPNGVVYFIELKRPKGGRLSALQKYQIQKLKANNANVRVIKNLKQIEAFIKEVQEA